MGAGHSELGNRFEYLKTCFWSLYEFFPHIVAAVTRPEDVTWGMEMSGLPFYDMLLIENLPKSAGNVQYFYFYQCNSLFNALKCFVCTW